MAGTADLTLVLNDRRDRAPGDQPAVDTKLVPESDAAETDQAHQKGLGGTFSAEANLSENRDVRTG